MLTAIAALMHHGWMLQPNTPFHGAHSSRTTHPTLVLTNSTANTTRSRRRQLLLDVAAFTGGAVFAEGVVRAKHFVEDQLESDNLATTVKLMD